MQIAILRYSGVAFGPRTPPFLVDKLETFPQLNSNEVYQTSNGYAPTFLN